MMNQNKDSVILNMDHLMQQQRNGHLEDDKQTEVEVLNDLDKRVPIAGVPELDEDDDEDNRPLAPNEPVPGVDDGFLTPAVDESDDEKPNDKKPKDKKSNGKKPKKPKQNVFTSYPSDYEGTGMVEIDGVLTQMPDVNAYQHKKTLAQGMMDLALLSANANQLRYVLESYKRHPYYYSSLTFISLSIIFQIAVGVGLIWNGRFDIKKKKDICRANKVNNYTIIGIFIVTVVNVFISSFGVADAQPDT